MKIIYFDKTDSTNERAKFLSEKIEHLTFIVAGTQTKGKGRNHRKWFSPPNENLYFSIFLKPEVAPKYLTGLPIITGHSVFKTIDNFISKKIYIKWPNDILIENRKISGILIEKFKNYFIIGIGINLNSERFPDIEDNIPTSLNMETGKFFDRLFILNLFYKNFYENYRQFIKEKKIPDYILKEVNKNLFLKNENIIVEFRNSIHKGKIVKILEDGSLKLDNGIIYAGDVKKIKTSRREI